MLAEKYELFWRVSALFDWAYEGDDEMVMEPAIDYLSKQDDQTIFKFDDLMAELLYELDTRQNMKTYSEINGDTSEDYFLYARCVALINGPEFYESVLNGSENSIWEMEFEAILELASLGWARKHDEDELDYPHFTLFSYETGSNEEGWA